MTVRAENLPLAASAKSEFSFSLAPVPDLATLAQLPQPDATTAALGAALGAAPPKKEKKKRIDSGVISLSFFLLILIDFS